jgi:hypothetical protein
MDLVLSGTRLKDANGRFSTFGGLLATRLMHGDYDNNLVPGRRRGLVAFFLFYADASDSRALLHSRVTRFAQCLGRQRESDEAADRLTTSHCLREAAGTADGDRTVRHGEVSNDNAAAVQRHLALISSRHRGSSTSVPAKVSLSVRQA